MAYQNPYAVLGVARDAPDYVVQAAYRACLKRHHPDASQDGDARARTEEILLAYTLIGTEEARARHDRDHPDGRDEQPSTRGEAPVARPSDGTGRNGRAEDGPGPGRRAGWGWSGPAALLVSLAAVAVALWSSGRSGREPAPPIAAVAREGAKPAKAERLPRPRGNVGPRAMPAVQDPTSAAVILDDLLRFTSPSRCRMSKGTEGLFDALITVDPRTSEGSRGRPIRVPGLQAPLAPTFERRVDKGDGLDVRDDEATLATRGVWHGLSVSRIRYRFEEESSFWEKRIRFAEPPERTRATLNALGFELPAVGSFRETSGPAEVTTGIGVEAVPGGSALTCGSSMYY